jgi:hypothetical protein
MKKNIGIPIESSIRSISDVFYHKINDQEYHCRVDNANFSKGSRYNISKFIGKKNRKTEKHNQNQAVEMETKGGKNIIGIVRSLKKGKTKID